MRVFSYVIVSDSGFAPNPFHGTCSLACCKPEIRRAAVPGDLIVGLSTRCERVVYAMQVSEVMGFDGYWADARFAAKRPRRMSERTIDRRGDNLYEPKGSGQFVQHPSLHSNDDGSENLRHKQRDLAPGRVILAGRFAYFGHDGPPLPSDLAFLKAGRGHRCRFTAPEVVAVQGWFEQLPQGVHGRPQKWNMADDSWMER